MARQLKHEDVLAALIDLLIAREPPANIRSDDGSEFNAAAIQKWLAQRSTSPPASPWENGYNESFNGSLRDKLLDGEIFYSLAEARVLIDAWRRHYNTTRPHSSLGYRWPARETTSPPLPRHECTNNQHGPTQRGPVTTVTSLIETPHSWSQATRRRDAGTGSAAGICHTDLAFRETALAAGFPAVLGHEDAGAATIRRGPARTRNTGATAILATRSAPALR